MSKYQVMPELTAEEYSELKADIAERGVMVPIEYDEQGNVLDGYHRLKICEELGIKDYPKVIRAGMSEGEKYTHARKLNMARRQLTSEQKREIVRAQLRATPEQSDRQIGNALGVDHKTIGVQRREMEGRGEIPHIESSIDTLGREQPRRKNVPTSPQGQPRADMNVPEHGDNHAAEAAEEIARNANAEPTALARQSSDFTTPLRDLREVNREGNLHKPVTVFNPTKREVSAMKNPDVVVRMQKTGTNALNAERQLHREAKAERKAYELSNFFPEEMCQLFTADIRKGLNEIADESVDVIITDPPYGREYVELYVDLSRVASRVLKEGCSLIVMTGQSYLTTVMAELEKYMSYHWTMCYLTPGGQSPQMFQKRVNTFWKPVLWYVKGEYNGDYIGDVLKSPVNANEKEYHEWGQSLGGMLEIVERFSNPKDVILDPFLGGGTTGVAAVCKGRKFIGTDIKTVHVGISRQRIKEEYGRCQK